MAIKDQSFEIIFNCYSNNTKYHVPKSSPTLIAQLILRKSQWALMCFHKQRPRRKELVWSSKDWEARTWCWLHLSLLRFLLLDWTSGSICSTRWCYESSNLRVPNLLVSWFSCQSSNWPNFKTSLYSLAMEVCTDFLQTLRRLYEHGEKSYDVCG